jgi:lipid-binding SYLF domain-containing protein
MRKAILSAILAIGMLGPGLTKSAAQSEAETGAAERTRVQKSIEVFKGLIDLPERDIPPALLRKAQAIAVIPGFVKAA